MGPLEAPVSWWARISLRHPTQVVAEGDDLGDLVVGVTGDGLVVERWFSALTTKKLQRSAHRNVKELAADIKAWVDYWNENPAPFVWHKSAEKRSFAFQRGAGLRRDQLQPPTASRIRSR